MSGRALKQERAVQTRALILAAASELFAENGYTATSILDVAERVEMTKGAVYFHFGSKDELAAAVVEHHYHRWPSVAEQAREEGLGPFETVVKMLDAAAVAFRDDPTMQAGARLQLERSLIDAELPMPYVDWTDLLTELLVRAEEEGQLREGIPPHGAAESLVSAFFGMQHVSEVLNHRADIQERWRVMSDLLFTSMRA